MYGKRKGVALAKREELSQEERKAGRRKKKRAFAKREGEREQQKKLRATLLPDSTTAKKLDERKMQQDLADAKRRGRVSEGVSSSGKNARAGTEYTRSAQFFKNMQDKGGKAGAMAGRKRAADGDGEDARKGARFKL